MGRWQHGSRCDCEECEDKFSDEEIYYDPYEAEHDDLPPELAELREFIDQEMGRG